MELPAASKPKRMACCWMPPPCTPHIPHASPPPPPSPIVAGTLYYAVAYDRLFASFGPYQLQFGALTPSSSAVLDADPAAFLGGLVANGSVAVGAGGQWTSVAVRPPCVAPQLCQQSLHGLQGGTPYRVFLVAMDSYGGADPTPAVVTVATADASAPALVPPTGLDNVTATGFSIAASMDAAGGLYWLVVAPKPGASTAADDLAAGTWQQVSSLAVPSPGGGRRLLAADEAAPWPSRQMLQSPATPAASGISPGDLRAPQCFPTNQTCSLSAAAAFAGAPGLSGGAFSVVASGCLPVPVAGQALQLPPLASLENNSLYFVLLASEDRTVPQPHHLAPPALFAVRTVDLSAPQFACGFPLVTNISTTSLTLSVLLTKKGAWVRFVLLPSSAAPPSAMEVLHGSGAGGAPTAAAGNLTHWGALPWEAAAAADGTNGGGSSGGDARKLWAPVGGLQGGQNYTAYLTLTADGSSLVAGGPVAVIR